MASTETIMIIIIITRRRRTTILITIIITTIIIIITLTLIIIRLSFHGQHHAQEHEVRAAVAEGRHAGEEALRRPELRGKHWAFIKGGCSGRGVRWFGVVLCNKPVHNGIQITKPCFHCTHI